MKNKILVLVIMSSLSACGLYNNVYSDYDRNTDFTQYKTYAWLETHKSHKTTPHDNDVIENNIKNYVDHELLDRNYTVNVDTPDILVELVLLSEAKEDKVTTNNPYNYNNYTYNNYPYNPNYNNNSYYNNQSYNRYSNYNNYNNQYYSSYNNYNPSSYNYTTETVEYTKSTITINIIDRKQNKLVWTGSAEGDIYDHTYLQSEFHPAIDKIMKQYPIKLESEK